MKTLFPYIITAMALMSFPQFDFCQTTAMINPNSPVSATGTVRFKNDDIVFSGNTATHADFDAAMAAPTAQYPVPVASGLQCNAGGSCYGASVNNEIFEVRDYFPFVANVIAQPSSMDGRAPAKTVISLILDGKSYTANDGSPFNETVQLELTFADPTLPDTKLSSVSLQHNSTVYAMVKGDSSDISITDFIWSSDHKSFYFSVDFNCIMRCWEHATTGKGDVNLKGTMSKIHVTVPGWITACK
jgi:hypothetical protein